MFIDYIFRMAHMNAAVWTSEGDIDLPLKSLTFDGPIEHPYERRFNPYDYNGG